MKPLSRRTLLRGLAGTALALPLLEAMGSRITTVTTPRRYVLVFGGFSLGADDSTDGAGGAIGNLVLPRGDALVLSDATAPLAPVLNDLRMVSGLSIPVGSSVGATPPGGRSGAGESFHQHIAPLLTGDHQHGDASDTRVLAPSSDQVFADAVDGLTPYRSLTMRVQAAPYAVSRTERMTPSFRCLRDVVVPVEPSTSPRRLFDDLTTMITPGDPAAAAVRDALLAERRSILDGVDRRMSGLLGRLGAVDRARMEQHYDEVRELELRLAGPSIAEHGACTLGARPVDPFVDDARGWSDEVTRASLMVDLTRMALACDQTRAAALMITGFRSELAMQAFAADGGANLHITHHSGTNRELLPAMQWHYQVFADLVTALRDAPDAGGSLLDSTVLVFVNEGGLGPPAESRPGAAVTAHSTDDMVMLVAGRGGGLVPGGQLIRTDRAHPAQVLISAMAAAGVEVDALGEVNGGLSSLFA